MLNPEITDSDLARKYCLRDNRDWNLMKQETRYEDKNGKQNYQMLISTF